MKEVLLLKCGELVLKGLNRRQFEHRLLANVKRRLAHISPCVAEIHQSILYIWPEEGADVDAIFEASKRVFGIASICRAAVCEKTLDAIEQTIQTYLAPRLQAVKRFKVETKRGDKRFPMTSIAVSQTVGGNLADRYSHLIPDMHTPECTICIEIREQYAFVHAGAVAGAGGMPVGTNGKAAFLLSGGIDSPVAGYMMAKRGLELVGVHFFSYPYTSERAKEKVIALAKTLVQYTGRMTLFVVPFTKIQEQIRAHCPEELFTLVMRRFMMRIAEQIALQNDCGGLITGESLGQVASQTMPAMLVTGDVCRLPVFRPCIGMDKEEIVQIARRIDTFDTSILPYEDCCTVFTPKHPNTKPKLHKVVQAESKLEVDALVQEAVSQVELLTF